MLLSESKRVASGGVTSRGEVWWVWWNCNKTMNDAVEHDDLIVSSTFTESFPLEITEHPRYTVPWVVVRHNKPSSPSLHHLNLGRLIFDVRIPQGRRVLQGWADVSSVGLLFDVLRSLSQVSP